MRAKSILVLVMAVFLLGQSSSIRAGTYSGGSGEPNDPYLISTAKDMQEIGAEPDDWDAHFLLTADINLADYTGTQFNIIGNDVNAFTGVFGGNGHTISNFTYAVVDTDGIGLFGYVYDANALIKDLTLTDPNIEAAGNSDFVGAVVGWLIDGMLTGCGVEGGSVSGDDYTGGLVGYSSNTISNCYATGDVSGDTFTGGLVGRNWYGTISNCYAAGAVDGNDYTGGLVGYDYSGFFTSCFWDIDVNPDVNGIGNGSDPNLIGKTTDQMQTETTFTDAGWDFTTPIWIIRDGLDYPKLWWTVICVDNDAPNDPDPNNPDISDPNEDGSTEHPFDAIQEAIDDANDGDVVVVADGDYAGTGNKNLDFGGRGITIRSLNGPEFTVIDCEYSGRGFYFHNGEDANSILDGLTITNGYANQGGGIFCDGSNPTISKCMIKNNTTSGWSDGGGISCKRSNVTITECILSNNTTNGKGGGISCCGYSKPVIRDCNIYNNSATHSGGGGISSFRSEPQITNCTINNNMARYGAGIFGDHDEESPTISNCTISGNASDYNAGGGIQGCNGPITNCIITCNTGVYHGGGGLNRCNGPITNCIITNNSVSNGDGGGVYRCNGPITNCVIAGNWASDDGGGIDVTSCGNTITNCTVTGNTALGYGGGIYAWFGSNVTVRNCVLWDNVAASGPEICLDYDQYGRPCTLTISYCDIDGGKAYTHVDSTCTLIWGFGNTESNPLFVDPANGDYHLKSEGWRWDTERKTWTLDDVTSRCIDAGNPGCVLGDELLSVPSDPNNQWGENLRINMGAFGGTAEASIPPYDWALLADLTNNGLVDFEDYAFQAIDWLDSEECQPGDLDRTGVVDLYDLTLLAEDWLKQTIWYEP